MPSDNSKHDFPTKIQPDPSQLILEYVEAKRERLMAIATGAKPSSREGEALRALMDFADGRGAA